MSVELRLFYIRLYMDVAGTCFFVRLEAMSV